MENRTPQEEKHLGDEIELRNEEERGFDEKEPSWWLRHGTGITCFVLLALAIIILFLPYPHSGGWSVWEIILERISALPN